ncbi:hypothetical protein [Actinoplanes sp. NPDC051851]|uniref:hypothetical protein n=1 Tax=Actinoplanes sp. NPDC051851 TaxID=3154753 RepID=UPI0034368CE5
MVAERGVIQMKKVQAAVLVSAGIVAQLALVAQPAFAATTAPSCVSRSISETNSEAGSLYTVHLANGCGSTQKVKVIVSLGFDSDCYTMANGSTKDFSFGIGSYEKTVTC